MNTLSKFIQRHLWSPYKRRADFPTMLAFECWHIQERARVAQNHLLVGIVLGCLLGCLFMLAASMGKGTQ